MNSRPNLVEKSVKTVNLLSSQGQLRLSKPNSKKKEEKEEEEEEKKKQKNQM